MDDFKLQLSVKIDGTHLLNIRDNNEADFNELVRACVDNAEFLLSAARALGGSPPPTPVVATGKPSNAVLGPASAEIGPVSVVGVSKSSLKKDGTPMTKPLYTVTFSNQKKLSTFDALVGQAAESLSGKPCYYVSITKGDYTNLLSIRASA